MQTESTGRGSPKSYEGCHPSLSSLRGSVAKGNVVAESVIVSGLTSQKFVPVVGLKQILLMPTKSSRALRWYLKGQVSAFCKKGIWCVRLNRKPSADYKQLIVVGIDPGSKKEGFTVKSHAHTYLNIQADAVTWVKDRIKSRSYLRRNRRNRNTPCRENRLNRSHGGIPPSTKARWDWKLRISKWLSNIYPTSLFIVEDVRAKTKRNQKNWNKNFSPLEVGKNWFYKELSKLAPLQTQPGWFTFNTRNYLGLKKTGKKLAEVFEAHCVDSWVLCWSVIGGVKVPNNTSLLRIKPIQIHRRQLHYTCPSKGGFRKSFGGTRSMGLKKGSIVQHVKYGICRVGGSSIIRENKRISTCDLKNYARLSQQIRPENCEFLAYSSWCLF